MDQGANYSFHFDKLKPFGEKKNSNAWLKYISSGIHIMRMKDNTKIVLIPWFDRDKVSLKKFSSCFIKLINDWCVKIYWLLSSGHLISINLIYSNQSSCAECWVLMRLRNGCIRIVWLLLFLGFFYSLFFSVWRGKFYTTWRIRIFFISSCTLLSCRFFHFVYNKAKNMEYHVSWDANCFTLLFLCVKHLSELYITELTEIRQTA